MVCGIKAEIAEPLAETPRNGYIGACRLSSYVRTSCLPASVPNIDLPALCSPTFKPGPPATEAQVYSNWLNDLLVSYVCHLFQRPPYSFLTRLRCQTVPLDSLCICPGKAVYVLYIDVVCINYDGNAFDAAVIAVMAALRNSASPCASHSASRILSDHVSPAARGSVRRGEHPDRLLAGGHPSSQAWPHTALLLFRRLSIVSPQAYRL